MERNLVLQRGHSGFSCKHCRRHSKQNSCKQPSLKHGFCLVPRQTAQIEFGDLSR
ncbi:hypothetical protein L798_03303 [Zootermopsis nevadensis]|uniref:Uncharacterized protein n=1 Tax=Zootermopsis nevadensis TaxID=136037 RepID=A0A067RN00_ZOONE|nr:hypothetical protein L798_03303 [Zootermopsis nevadensis]